jgi:hypothetical protein
VVDIVVTSANVIKGTGAKTRSGIAGTTITAGQTLYKDTSDSDKYKLYDSDGATAIVRKLAGVSLHGASAGQPITLQYEGNITIGATVAAGTVYLGSDTPGGIRPNVDSNSGDYITVLGVGISTTEIYMKIVETTVAKP